MIMIINVLWMCDPTIEARDSQSKLILDSLPNLDNGGNWYHRAGGVGTITAFNFTANERHITTGKSNDCKKELHYSGPATLNFTVDTMLITADSERAKILWDPLLR